MTPHPPRFVTLTLNHSVMHDPCMATKTITLDLDAYDQLARRKKPGQSFSDVVKENFGGRKTAGDLLKATEGLRVSTETLDAIEQLIKDRKRDIAKAPKL